VGAVLLNKGIASRQRPFDVSSSPRFAAAVASGVWASAKADSTANENPHSMTW
jgi:hypothetical protein